MELDPNDVPRFTPTEERAYSADLEPNPVLEAFRGLWDAVGELTAILARADERR